MPVLGSRGGASVSGFGGLANLGYFLRKSLRFRASNSAYLSRTPASAGNRRTWTWSGWVKRGSLGAVYPPLFMGGTGLSDSGSTAIIFNNDSISLGGYNTYWRTTSAVYRDPSAWYHIVVALDTTQAVAANRALIYVNGVQVTSFSTNNTITQNADFGINQTALHEIGYQTAAWGLGYFDGYMTEVNFIDGQQLTPSSFAKTDATTGQWIPKKFGGAYGTNGFHLNFSDASAATAAAIGKDSSGNGNNWTPNNISVTSGATYDSMTDVPSLGPAASNYCTQNPLAISSANPSSLSDGNLKQTGNSGGWYQGGVMGTIGITSGKFYWEVKVSSLYATNGYVFVGIAPTQYQLPAGNDATTTLPGQSPWYGSCVNFSGSGQSLFYVNSASSSGTNIGGSLSITTGDVIQIAFDADSGKIWYGKNNTWYNSGNPASGTNATGTLTTTGYAPFVPCHGTYTNSDIITLNYGQQGFAYTPPSGFKALNTYNIS